MLLREISIFFCLIYFAGHSQNGLEIGLKSLPSYSLILNFQDYSKSNKYIANFGFNYGLEAAYSLDEYVSIRSGYIFSWIEDQYVQDNVLVGKWLHYRKVPIIIKLNSNPYDGKLISFYFGPQLAFLNTAEHMWLEYCSKEEARKANPMFSFIEKPIEKAQLDYAKVFGAGLYNTEYLYKERMIDIVMGAGYDWPLNAYFLLSTSIMMEFSAFNIEDRTYQLRQEPFWINYWGNEKRSSSFYINISFNATIYYIFPKKLLFKVFKSKRPSGLDLFEG